MGFPSSGRRAIGATTTTAFNSSTKVLSGVVSFPGASVSGLTVAAYLDGSSTNSGSTTTAGDGSWSIDLSAISNIVTTNHNIEARVSYSATNSAFTAYTIAAATATLSGDDALRRTALASTGLNGTGADAVATLTRTGTSVSGISFTNAGTNYEPGEWQIVTTGSGGGTGLRGMVQANSAGVLDPATFTVTGTDPYGVALSGGTGYTVNPPSSVITRYVTMGVGCFYFQQGATVNGDIMLQVGSSTIALTLLTGISPRLDLNNANAATGARMKADGGTLGAGVMRRLLFTFNTKLPAASGGLRFRLDEMDIANYTAVNGYVWNQTSAGTLNGRLNLNNTSSAVGIWGPSTGSGTIFCKGAGQLAYLATGYSAIDAIAGTAVPPNIDTQSIRDRFTPGGINIADGSGGTGRQPNFCVFGQDFAGGVNHGFSGNFTVVGDFA